MGEKYPALRYVVNMGGEFKNGIWTLKCDSWSEFEDRVNECKKHRCKYLWRGQDCGDPLLPGIYRSNKPEDKEIELHLYQFKKIMPGADNLEKFLKLTEKEETREFKEALTKYYRMIHPVADDNDPKEKYLKEFKNDIYWAIGQHHGLKTPLLDWTMNPYKALFFAFCERKENVEKRFVFGLAEKNRLLLEKNGQTKRYIEFLSNLGFIERVFSSSDSHTNFKERIAQMFDRIKAQEGLFTRTLYNKDIEGQIKKYYSFYKKLHNEEIVFLVKILIPDGAREVFLKS